MFTEDQKNSGTEPIELQQRELSPEKGRRLWLVGGGSDRSVGEQGPCKRRSKREQEKKNVLCQSRRNPSTLFTPSGLSLTKSWSFRNGCSSSSNVPSRSSWPTKLLSDARSRIPSLSRIYQPTTRLSIWCPTCPVSTTGIGFICCDNYQYHGGFTSTGLQDLPVMVHHQSALSFSYLWTCGCDILCQDTAIFEKGKLQFSCYIFSKSFWLERRRLRIGTMRTYGMDSLSDIF
ncbi:uncharacterized protein LOC120915966 [Rana temporaria]|uniref:uncharacterized protein LOC120915966 n=1 Tax=Rana temporaria TaxID=8407 RepID=UPI001AAD9394|nr:uncharacterized protein LOC120915966 [Rana temporaria]